MEKQTAGRDNLGSVVEMVTHLAFYTSRSKTWSVFPMVEEVYKDE